MAETDEIAIANSAPPPPKEQTIFSLQIFQTLDLAQSGHGIPHKDFGQYQQYLSKRLSRVRHVKAVRSTLVHNHKYVEGVSGRRHAYASRNESPEHVEHENVVWSLFYQGPNEPGPSLASCSNHKLLVLPKLICTRTYKNASTRPSSLLHSWKN